MIRTTGLARRRDVTQSRWLSGGRRFGDSSPLVTVIQPRGVRVHNQYGKPSCVGHAHASGLESVLLEPVSAVGIWEGARHLMGLAGDSDVGTRGEYAIEWLERHGWATYEPGEDERGDREDEDHRVGNTLAAAMRAHNHRGRVRARTIDTRQADARLAAQVVAALRQPRTYVVREGATTEAYQRGRFGDTVLGPEYFAGHAGGHAERIAGYDAERGAFLVQGSWGDWTGCPLPGGGWALGCVWISRAALGVAWAIDLVRVTNV